MFPNVKWLLPYHDYNDMFYLDLVMFDPDATHTVVEDEGPLEMKVTLSRPLPYDILLKFLYQDLSAHGKLVMYCVV